jgi:hypothetical protein
MRIVIARVTKIETKRRRGNAHFQETHKSCLALIIQMTLNTIVFKTKRPASRITKIRVIIARSGHSLTFRKWLNARIANSQRIAINVVCALTFVCYNLVLRGLAHTSNAHLIV